MSLLSTVTDTFRLLAHLCEDGLPTDAVPASVEMAQRALLAAGYDPGPIDGVIGPRTRAAYARARADHMAHGSLRVIRYDETGGADLRATVDGGPHDGRTYDAPTDAPPQVVVWHWTAGQTTAHGLVGSFRRSRLSSHFAVDATGIYQLLPVECRGWHARWVNPVSIGIDICQPVRPERINDAHASGYDCEAIDNPTDPRRGSREVLSLDPRIAAKCRWLAEYLSTTYGIAKDAPRYPDGRVRHDQVFASLAELGDWSGHVGHHHVEAPNRRSDIAPWWPAIFNGTPMGDRSDERVVA